MIPFHVGKMEVMPGLVLFSAFFCDLEKVMNCEVSHPVRDMSSFK